MFPSVCSTIPMFPSPYVPRISNADVIQSQCYPNPPVPMFPSLGWKLDKREHTDCPMSIDKY